MVIAVDQLSYTYKDGTKALDHISFKIPDHSKIAIMGPNGSGKSTLLHHLNGIFLPQEGSVEVLGTFVNKKNEKQVRAKVGLVFQDPDDQVFSSTVWEDVAFGPENMGLLQEDIDTRVEKALKAVDMWGYRDKTPYQLSYGQKKRVAIAGVLAMDCELLILDEPIAYLDPEGQEKLFDLLDQLYEQGITIIIATHDVDMACEWAEDIILLKDGKLLAMGGTEILTEEKLIQEAHLTLPVISKLFKKLNKDLDNSPSTLEAASKLLNQWISTAD